MSVLNEWFTRHPLLGAEPVWFNMRLMLSDLMNPYDSVGIVARPMDLEESQLKIAKRLDGGGWCTSKRLDIKE